MNATLNFLESWKHRYLSGDPEVGGWYPSQPHEIARHAQKRPAQSWTPLSSAESEEWIAWLRAHQAPAEVLRNVEALSHPDTLCVITGQQAGLFGGPIFCLYKAAATIHAARLVEKETGRRCVPVFWVASDDHDFPEVATVNWLSTSAAPRTWTASPEPGRPGSPVYARPLLPPLLDSFLADFSEGEAETEFRKDLFDFLHGLRQHPGGATWESQFVRCLLRWIGSLGIVPFAPRLGFARQRAIPVIAAELQQPAASTRLVRDAGSLLDSFGASGHTLHRRGDEANVFLECEGVRGKITWHGGDNAVVSHPVTGEELARFSGEQILAHLREFPSRFGPGAALRPIVQDAILPTVGAVLGPSELLYHAQIRDLYGHFGVFRPTLLPRPSAVLLDRRTERLMEKLGLEAEELVRGGPDDLKHRAASVADPTGVRERVEAQLAESTRTLQSLRDLLEAETRDTGLVKAAEKMAQAVSSSEAKLRERLDQFLIRRAETVADQVERIGNALWPLGQLQERWLGWTSPLLAQYGPTAPAWVAEHVPLDASKLHIIHLSGVNGE